MLKTVRTENLKKRPTVFNTFKRDCQLWMLVLPAIAVILIFNYIPMYGIQLAFREYSFKAGIIGGKFAGLKYFNKYFTSNMFGPTILNTFTIAGTSILMGFPAPILLALLFNQIRRQRAKHILQTVSYMPHFISMVVMVSLLQVFLSNTGLISMVLKGLGLVPKDLNLMGSPKSFVWVYVLSGIWQNCGWDSIIYLAALSSVDSQLYEACRIDGANRLQITWHIDIPTLIPTIIILLILNCGNILSVGFEKAFLMQNQMNLGVSQVITTYVYNVGVRAAPNVAPQFSYGSAIGLFNTLVNFVFLLIVNQVSKRITDVSLW